MKCFPSFILIVNVKDLNCKFCGCLCARIRSQYSSIVLPLAIFWIYRAFNGSLRKSKHIAVNALMETLLCTATFLFTAFVIITSFFQKETGANTAPKKLEGFAYLLPVHLPCQKQLCFHWAFLENDLCVEMLIDKQDHFWNQGVLNLTGSSRVTGLTSDLLKRSRPVLGAARHVLFDWTKERSQRT